VAKIKNTKKVNGKGTNPRVLAIGVKGNKIPIQLLKVLFLLRVSLDDF
jgi:hypothetical protein